MNPSGKFFYIIIELSKIQNSTASSYIYILYIYIYACIYVGYTEKQYIEKQDALSAVSCSLREMERHSNEPATLWNEGTNQKKKSLIR